MKKLAVLVIFLVVAVALVTAEGQYETVGAMKSMPSGVQTQARWGMETPASWKEFDGSGDVKFLQVQNTASASPAGRSSVLDGSIGERIIEIQAEPNIRAAVVEWSLQNKGPNDVWVVSAGMQGAGFNMKIASGASSTFKMDLDGSRYTYIVVDNQGGGKTELSIKAKMAGTDAKTARGKSMLVIWF
jgi:hypothetical protein